MPHWIEDATAHVTRANDRKTLFIETVKLLEDLHCHIPNIRGGIFIEGSDTEFFPFHKLFAGVESVRDRSRRAPEYPKEIQVAFGKTAHEQINAFLDLQKPISIQIETYSKWKQLFGYKFCDPINLRVDPLDIVEIAAQSGCHYYIRTANFAFEVTFRRYISISRPSKPQDFEEKA